MKNWASFYIMCDLFCNLFLFFNTIFFFFAYQRNHKRSMMKKDKRILWPTIMSADRSLSYYKTDYYYLLEMYIHLFGLSLFPQTQCYCCQKHGSWPLSSTHKFMRSSHPSISASRLDFKVFSFRSATNIFQVWNRKIFSHDHLVEIPI